MNTLNGISQVLADTLASKPAAPFLFVGSGFSRRYIGLETWDALLEKFCEGIGEFSYYSSSVDGQLPAAAGLIANDFFKHWWKDQAFEQSRISQGKKMSLRSSPLKLEISKYLREKSKISVDDSHLKEELALLTKLNVDGIITTNWDTLLENLFPEYRVFIGQEELLFSNPQSIAEIYKIHGCCSKPESLVLTNEDYNAFNGKYPYLVAKLITIFVEHPVFFFGYSLGDENVREILGSIVGCLSEKQLEKFSENIFFVKRASPDTPSRIYPSTMQFGSYALNLQVIETSDFSEVYAGLETVKRKIPARVLRTCKEQMYELVKSTAPDTKLAVANLDDLEDQSAIEFVVGVGVAKEAREQDELSQQGYKGITLRDLFWDVITEEKNYDAANVLNEVFPAIPAKHATFFPGYKYLKEVRLTKLSELDNEKFSHVKPFFCKYKKSRFRTNAFARPYIKNAKGMKANEIVESFPVEKAVVYLPFLEDDAFDLEVVQRFLLENFERMFDNKDSYQTYYRKLAVLYDRVKNGF